MATGKTQKPAKGSALDFEAQLWAAAGKMRGQMDASEYKHIVLGLISPNASPKPLTAAAMSWKPLSTT